MGGRLRIRIHCRRGSDLVVLLTLTLLATATLGILFFSDGRAGASPSGEPQQLSVSPRRYYLTIAPKLGNQALTACATGYHTASLWEILDTTNLQYNKTLGQTREDGGSGPPVDYSGWVRTGYSSLGSTTPGQGNCLGWTTIAAGNYGTRVQLPDDWTVATEQSAPWEASVATCSTSVRVWCVADNFIGGENYLPNVVKSY